MRKLRLFWVLLLTVLLAYPVALPAAFGHEERDAAFPAGDGITPEYRQSGPELIVCKPDTAERIEALPAALRTRNLALLDRCQFEDIQAAVNAVAQQGSRILVLPGLYREEPSLEDRVNPPPGCEELAERQGGADEEGNGGIGGTLGSGSVGAPEFTYEEQSSCPHVQNLIAVFGDTDADGVCDNSLCKLQIEGTGANPADVIVDGDYSHLNGLRADRADGFYLRNMTFQRFEFNAVYTLETDGFTFDQVVTRWNDEYGFLSFAVDHGRYENCSGNGNGDSAIYPGSASDINQGAGLIENTDLRFATEIRGCRGHNNALGYSGTGGNSVWSHDNEFDHNATGIAMDSLFPDHPGLPQDHALVEDNLIHENNNNYYKKYVQTGACEGEFARRGYDDGVVCPVIPLRVGTGTFIAGGNANLIRGNSYYDNWEQGTWQIWVPAALRNEPDPTKQYDTSNFNTVRDNVFGINPNGGKVQPQGFADMHWDAEGEGNCWETNTAGSGAPTTAVGELQGAPLPTCALRPPFTPGPAVAVNASCATYDRETMPDPEGCTWFEDPAMPAGRQPEGPTLQRVAGQDRIQTAVAASRESFPGHAETVVIARADLYPDALAGAPLAGKVGAPMLLATRDGLTPEVVTEIQRLGARQAILLGGTGALTAGVESALTAAGIADVVRVGGADRFATAVQIAVLVGGAHAFLAKGVDSDPNQGWADALAASSVGAFLKRPIILTTTGALPASTAALLDKGDITDVKIVGGPAAVSAAVETVVKDKLEDVERLFGADRYLTSLAVADYALKTGADRTELWLATGVNWPDGIAAGGATAVDEGILVLVGPNGIDAGTAAARWLEQRDGAARTRDVVENIRILGGQSAVATRVDDQLTSTYGATVGDARGDRSSGNVATGGEFAAFADAPAAYRNASGHATMTRTITGTTRVIVRTEGLPANTATSVHVHTNTCADDRGGPHFKFDPAGGDTPPNEIQPSFTTDAAGVGLGDATAWDVAGPETRSVVVHDGGGAKVLCANLD